MNFICIEGALGSGKTTLASIYALYYHLKSNCTLYSNYGLKNSIHFDHIEQFKDVAVQPSSIITIDEGHVDLDARSFNTNHVKFISHISYYLRKLRSTFIITSPSFNDLDSRIRGITNILIEVRKDQKYFYYDHYDVQKRKFIKTVRINQNFAFSLDIFNTWAMVEPLKVHENRKEFEQFLRELKQINYNYYLEKARRKEERTA